ncbi:helix-turn-helix domain-containing protein [Gordonia sp. HY285]|uniref:helix-turn-helix domain-containing protein n=1 Tax=Gordonia liuliyuniae TaxID=2911517 RepID=UPI001F1FCF72|nr:helix-turn-helix transcriptional regulator [Gordonia liuliyuniae]MCF8610005.1 helix-turn-helix domain-containing protein [Gordonia liuliyuniae]
MNGEWIKGRRHALGMKQAEFAELARGYGLPWSQATLSRIELGGRGIRFDELLPLAKTLGITVEELPGIAPAPAAAPGSDFDEFIELDTSAAPPAAPDTAVDPTALRVELLRIAEPYADSAGDLITVATMFEQYVTKGH